MQIGHSLISLKVAHGFAGSVNTFPSQSVRSLTSLQELDFSNNQLRTIHDTSFHFLQNLRTLELNDNAIEQISKGTFQVGCASIEIECRNNFFYGHFTGGHSFASGNHSLELQ